MEINVLSVKEIISNYKIFKSEKQKEALKSNFYLQGFGEAIAEITSGIIPENLSIKEENKDYKEGRYEASDALKNLHSKLEYDDLKKVYEELRNI